MPVDVIMPSLGFDMTEGTLARWLVKEGERVEKGQAIAEIETEKATVEIQATASGTLAGIVVQPGKTVPVGTVMATILDPDLLQAALRLATAVILPYVRALEDAGADMIAILEPSGSLLSPRRFGAFCGQYVAEIIAAMRVMPILHICGQTTHLLDGMIATGAQGLSLDSAVYFPQAIQRLPDDMVLIGNLDTVVVMNQMAPREVYQTATDLIAAMAPHPNFILSSACDLPLDTPHENIDALLQAALDARR